MIDAPDSGAEAAGDTRTFVPSGRPGARLPHAWTRERNGRGSILDWVPLDRFLLLVGPEGAAWTDAVTGIDDIPIVERRLRAAEVPALSTWRQTAGIGPAGALLIRPDQHVAWRSAGAIDDTAGTLRTVLGRVLCQDPNAAPR